VGATETVTRLLQVQVQGLAGRQATTTLNLRPDVNIFFGLNGSGKTTLLKVIHSALDNDPSSLARAPFKSAAVQFLLNGGQTPIERRIGSHSALAESPEDDYADIQRELIAERTSLLERMTELQRRALTASNAETRRRFEAEISFMNTRLARLTNQRLENEWITKPAFSGSQKVNHRYLSTNRIITDTLPLRTSRARVSETDIDEVFADQIETVWRTYTNRVLSTVTDIQSHGYREILRSLLFQLPGPTEGSPAEIKRAYDQVLDFIGTTGRPPSDSDFSIFQRRYNEEPLFRGVVQDIDGIEKQMEEAEEPRRRLAALARSFFSEGKSISFTNSGIRAEVLGDEIPLAALSSGEKQLVRILIDVIMTDDSVIIVDEPELSMHIDWQRELVKAMRTVNPAAQIIMATHSPEIMEHVPDHCIFRL
jgi:predicted ATPase